LLDGTRDQTAIANDLASEVASGNLRVNPDGDPIDEPATLRQAFVQDVKLSLRRIACQALLLEAS
jgi:hypothetical protein